MFSDSAHSTSLVTHKNDNQLDTCDVRVWLSVLSQCAVTTGPRAMCADAQLSRAAAAAAVQVDPGGWMGIFKWGFD